MASVEQPLSAKRSSAILLVGAALVVLLLLQAAQPVQRVVSERYTARGDAFFKHLNYPAAEAEYAKALRANPNNQLAADHQNLARNAETDIALARAFFQAQSMTAVVEKIDAATTTYATAPDALTAGVKFFQVGEFVYAQYPLQQAVQLDPNYPEAWHYLALTYDVLAKTDASLAAKAADARAKRDHLSPLWLGK